MYTIENIILNSEIFYHKICNLGLGIFAKKNISQGEIIHKFCGRIIDYNESINIPGKEECKALQLGENKYLDLDLPGVLINHSCDPNSGILNDFDLIAIKDIFKDDQIVYDYSTTMDDGYQMECLCNSINCRKVVEDFKFLKPEIRNSYIERKIVMSFLLK